MITKKAISKYILLFILLAVFLSSGCAYSVREPLAGPPVVPIAIPDSDQIKAPAGMADMQLPRLITTPVENNDASVVPIFKPERHMVWHIQGYTKSSSVYIGPHIAVLKIEPGQFLRDYEGAANMPVATPFVETEERKSSRSQKRPDSSLSSQQQSKRYKDYLKAKDAKARQAAAQTKAYQATKPDIKLPDTENLPQPVRDHVDKILKRSKELSSGHSARVQENLRKLQESIPQVPE